MSDDVKRCIPFDRAIVFIEYISTGKYFIHLWLLLEILNYYVW